MSTAGAFARLRWHWWFMVSRIPIVPRFFRAQTWCATATSIAAVIAALNVAFGWPPSHHDCLWGGALIVSGIALLRQTLSFCRAPGYS